MKIRLFLIGMIILLLTACSHTISQESVEKTEKTVLAVFLLNQSSDALVEVSVDDMGDTLDERIWHILDILSIGDEDAGYMPTIPEETLILGVQVLGDGVRLELNPNYDAVDDVQLLICRSSLIKSITALEEISYIEFYVDGLPLKDDNGKVYGPFYEEDIITANLHADDGPMTHNIILYYPDEDGEWLVQINREIAVRPSENIEKKIIEALMVTESDDMISPIPDGTEVRNVMVQDGICYVDFNDAFRLNHYGGSTGELMTVYSIVNTLTERSNISRVQFMIEGEKTDFFKGHLDFSQLFEYNIELIYKASNDSK